MQFTSVGDRLPVNRVHRHLIIASLPAAAMGVVNLGALVWLPQLLAALIVSFGWAWLFARVRGRPIDPVWIPAAWLFSLMLPAGAPLGLALLALCFGLVFGCFVFGGSGRSLVNPALLAIVFLAVSYPQLVDADAFGASSAAACLAGAAWLVAMQLARPSVIGGGLIAVILLSLSGSEPSWAGHLLAGNFAFALAFVASDAGMRPKTATAGWIYGALFGLLVVFMRTANPAQPEGTWAALLLASLCIPLFDHLVGSVGRLRQGSTGA